MIWRGHANFLPTVRSGLSFLYTYTIDLLVPFGYWFKERVFSCSFIYIYHQLAVSSEQWSTQFFYNHEKFLSSRNVDRCKAEKKIYHKPKEISSRWEFFVIVHTDETNQNVAMKEKNQLFNKAFQSFKCANQEVTISTRQTLYVKKNRN